MAFTVYFILGPFGIHRFFFFMCVCVCVCIFGRCTFCLVYLLLAQVRIKLLQELRNVADGVR